VAGNVEFNHVKLLAEKWFGPIPSGERYQRSLPIEPEQKAARHLEVKSGVPLDALIKCWHMSSRMDDRYYTFDLISDILSGGGSSRLFQTLVKEKQLFSSIDCYHYGSTEPGLMTIEGKVVKGVDIREAEKALMEELKHLQENGISELELEKVKNKAESSMAFEDMSLMNRASSLAMYENLGDANLINTELSKYQAVTAEQIKTQSQWLFRDENCSTMYYLSEN
jgi:predicted Zn-dependent peptidase